MSFGILKKMPSSNNTIDEPPDSTTTAANNITVDPSAITAVTEDSAQQPPAKRHKAQNKQTPSFRVHKMYTPAPAQRNHQGVFYPPNQSGAEQWSLPFPTPGALLGYPPPPQGSAVYPTASPNAPPSFGASGPATPVAPAAGAKRNHSNVAQPVAPAPQAGAAGSQTQTPAPQKHNVDTATGEGGTPAEPASGQRSRGRRSRGEYVSITREDETEIFRLCLKNQQLYLSRGKGPGKGAFYKHIAEKFASANAKPVHPSSVQRHVQLETKRYIERLKEGTEESEEVTQWTLARNAWAQVDLKYQAEYHGDLEAQRLLDREAAKRQLEETIVLDSSDSELSQLSSSPEGSVVGGENEITRQLESAVREGAGRPQKRKMPSGAGSSFKALSGIMQSWITTQTNAIDVERRKLQFVEQRVALEKKKAQREDREDKREEEKHRREADRDMRDEARTRSTFEFRQAEFRLREREVQSQERIGELVKELANMKQEFQERFAKLEGKLESGMGEILDLLQKQQEES